ARVQRNPVRTWLRIHAGGDIAAADLAFDGIEAQRLAVAPDHPAHRLQLASARQQAAQRLKRDPAAPSARAKAGASASCSAPISPSISISSPSVTATLPRRREPPTLLSRSSKVSLLPASCTREDRPMFCASGSAGLRSSSGPKS